MKRFVITLLVSFVSLTLSMYVVMLGATLFVYAMGYAFGMCSISVCKIAVDLFIYEKFMIPVIFIFSYIITAYAYLNSKNRGI